MKDLQASMRAMVEQLQARDEMSARCAPQLAPEGSRTKLAAFLWALPRLPIPWMSHPLFPVGLVH